MKDVIYRKCACVACPNCGRDLAGTVREGGLCEECETEAEQDAA